MTGATHESIFMVSVDRSVAVAARFGAANPETAQATHRWREWSARRLWWNAVARQAIQIRGSDREIAEPKSFHPKSSETMRKMFGRTALAALRLARSIPAAKPKKPRREGFRRSEPPRGAAPAVKQAMLLAHGSDKHRFRRWLWAAAFGFIGNREGSRLTRL